MQNKSNELSFKNQNIYIGLDTHLKSIKTTILTEHIEHKTFVMDPKAELLHAYLKKNFPGANYYSAYEASFGGFSLHRNLVRLGIKNIVVHPADIPTTNKEKVQKEDKRDSRKIAKMLRARILQGIYVPSEEMQELRNLVRYRRTLAKEIGRKKNKIKSMLYFYGVEIPPEMNSASRYWSKKFTDWLNSLTFMTTEGKTVMESIIKTTEYSRKQLLEINNSIRKMSKEGKYARILNCLMSIPGVGIVTAITVLTEVEDINRFKTDDQLCSFIGIVPSTNSSGEKEVSSGITSRCNKSLRQMIIESSWIAARRDPSLALYFNNYCRRMKKNQAIVRIAKKLVKRIKYVMKNECEYVLSKK